MLSEMLRLSVNTLTADDKYSLCKRDNLRQGNQMQSSNQKKNCQLFAAFLKSKSNFQIFLKNMSLTAYLFPKLETAKDVVS